MLTHRTSLFSQLSLFSIAGAAVLILLAGSAQANTLKVPSQYPTIQAAIDAATQGDTIRIAAGTYRESLDWEGKDLTVSGAGAGQSIIDPGPANGGPGGGCLYTSGLSAASRIEGLTFQGGYQGVDLVSNYVIGGGMFNDNSSPTVTNCAFQGNSATDGGGMSNYGNSTVSHCTFTGNVGVFLGGSAMDNEGDVTITDCDFTGNLGLQSPIAVVCYGNTTVTRCSFTSNNGLAMRTFASATVTDCNFAGNSGGLFSQGDVRVTDCNFVGNSGGYVGGLYLHYCQGTVTGCTFTGNSAGQGGAMRVLFSGSHDATTVSDCKFTNNVADEGGAIANGEASLTMTNCTLTSNTASQEGGGIFNTFMASLTLTNCDIAGNSAGVGGAIYNGTPYYGYPTNLALVNCIVWGNTAGSANGFAAGPGGNATVNFSDIQDASSGAPDANGNFAADPRFVRNPGTNGAGDYGDLRVLLGSPCIDAGSDAAVAGVAADFDGSARISRAHVDLGAYEYQNHAPSLTVPASAQSSVGNMITIPTNATDPDSDTVTYSLIGAPSWASINSSSGLVTLSPPAGANGQFAVLVKAADPYGASNTKSISMSVCPILIDSVTVSKKNGVTTVQFNVGNSDGTIVNNVSVNSSTLKGIATSTVLPIIYPQLKQGVVKSVQLKFNGVSSGTGIFSVNGTSSAGPFSTSLTVNVP